MLAAVLGLTMPAQAAIYSYAQANGETLTVDTVSGTGTLIGDARNISFSGEALKSFTGGDNPTGMFDISVDANSRTNSGWVFGSGQFASGNTWAPVFTGHQQKLIFQSNNRYNFWAIWTPINGTGPTLGDIYGSYSSTSTGGTPVPAPAAILLLGLGVAGLMGGRKWAKQKA